ncbi:MAG: M14 family zinc carboxypeptidase, partial [Rhodothermales bacterium]
VYSYDSIVWHFFPENHRDASAATYSFWLDRPFEQDTVYIAYGLPYPYSQVERLIERLRTIPYVGPTRSSDASLVIGLSPGGGDEAGRLIHPKKLFGFRIADESDSMEPRANVILVGGVHPNEPLGNHTIEGLLDYLLGDTPDASELRRRAAFYVYPMVNPDGRFAGYNRSTVQHVDRDANRVWREDLYEDMDDIRQIAEAMKRDVERPPTYFVDFHCWTHNQRHFGILAREEGFHRDPFWRALRQLEPSLSERDSGWTNWSAETFAFKRLGARFAMTLETMFIPDENIDRFHRLGQNIGMAFARAITVKSAEQVIAARP